MSLIDNLWRFKLSLQLAYVAFIACVMSFVLYSSTRDALSTANEQRYQSLELTHELRQSSDDLTRMVRTYAVTGDRHYLDYFNEIAAIRDGISPRPQEYENVYWDLVLDDRRPSPMGAPEALLQRLMAAGFTQEELNRLTEAKASSDRLIDIERQAIALVEEGENTANEIQQNRLEAQGMLHSATYHRARADIMRPIAEVVRMVNDRTAQKVETTERHIAQLLGIFIFSGIVLVSMLWLIQRNLRLVLGGSVSRLSKVAVNAANGNNSAKTSADGGDPDSIIGKLMEVQQISAKAEGQRQDTERALSEAERRFRTFASELLEGVCVVQDALIRFVNPRLEEIMEHPEADLVDRPFIQFIHHDDRLTLMNRYRNRVDAIEIETNHEFCVNTGHGAVLKVMTRASEFEWGGRPATLYFVNIAGI